MFTFSAIQAHNLRELINSQEPGEQRNINARVASANHIARRVVYELDAYFEPSEQLQQIFVFDEDATIRPYNIIPIDTKHLGIVPYILTSMEPDNARVHLVFRGSKSLPAWCRSTESPAPGCQSFHEERYTIIRRLHTIISELWHGEIHLIISGHSLGGSDAQACATEVMRVLYEKHKDNARLAKFTALDKIKKITVNHVNSAGVQHVTTRDCKKYIKYLTEHKIIDMNVMCVLTAGDAVQQTGQSHILLDVDDSIARVELVKLKSEYEGWLDKKFVIPVVVSLPVTFIPVVGYTGLLAYSAFKAHRLRIMDNEDFTKQTFKTYDNSSEEGREKIISKLSKHPLDNSHFNRMLMWLHLLQESITHTKRDAVLDPHYVLVDKDDNDNNDNDSEKDYDIVHDEVMVRQYEMIVQQDDISLQTRDVHINLTYRG